jgi:hypothetical protein
LVTSDIWVIGRKKDGRPIVGRAAREPLEEDQEEENVVETQEESKKEKNFYVTSIKNYNDYPEDFRRIALVKIIKKRNNYSFLP